jgi:hypothetical protein
MPHLERLVKRTGFTAERDQTFWQSMFTGQRAFQPDLSVLAVEAGAVLGYVLAYIYEAEAEATGCGRRTSARSACSHRRAGGAWPPR